MIPPKINPQDLDEDNELIGEDNYIPKLKRKSRPLKEISEQDNLRTKTKIAVRKKRLNLKTNRDTTNE